MSTRGSRKTTPSGAQAHRTPQTMASSSEQQKKRDRIEKLCDQANQVYNKNGKLSDTYFYKVVLGGNVRVAEKAVDHMASSKMAAVVDWLLQREQQKQCKEEKSKFVLKATQILMFMLLSLISAILTPVFYPIHALTTYIGGQRKRRLADDVKLPLAFAAFSENNEMVKYFLSSHVNIEDTDKNGNNVFHYIADLSSESSDRAIKIFHMVEKFINDPEKIQHLLASCRNSSSLTALEYTSKYGSPALLTEILNHPHVLLSTVFSVGEDDVTFSSLEDPDELHDKDAVSSKTKLNFIDVSVYEGGSIAQQSTILNMLSDRDITMMTLEELQLFKKASFVGKWIDLKVKQMFVPVAILHILDIFFTIFFVLFMMNFPYDLVNMKLEHRDVEILVKEIIARSTNESYIFKDHSKDEVMEKIHYEAQLEAVRWRMYDDDRHRMTLLKYANRSKPSISQFLKQHEDWMDIFYEEIPGDLLSDILDTAIELVDFMPNWPMIYTYRYLPFVMYSFARDVVKTYPHIASSAGFSSFKDFESETNFFFYQNFSVLIDNYSFRPSDILSSYTLYQYYCANSFFFRPDQVNVQVGIPPPADLYMDGCQYIKYFELANTGCKGKSQDYVYKKLEGSMLAYFNESLMIFTLFFVSFALLSTHIYPLIDYLERVLFIYTCTTNHSTAYDMAITFLSRKVPGSYTRKAINLITYMIVIIFLYSMVFSIGLSRDNDAFLTFVVYGLIVALLLRFLMHIHSLRLLPSIGNFVISTFMMGTNLLYFSVVYGFVVFVFAIVFYLLTSDPNCPIENHVGFTSLMESMFSAFKLTFGHGEFDAYDLSVPVKVSYTLYVIICGLLLMNLIIAVMSTTATEIMTEPWKQTLWHMEWLDEALSAEFTLKLFSTLCCCCVKQRYWLHRKAGYHVLDVKEEGKSKSKVYIEVFECPGLE